MKKFLLWVSACLILSGCAASGPMFAEQISKIQPLHAENARLFVFRTGDSDLAGIRSTPVKLNGETLGKCDYKGFNWFDVTGGKHTLSVDLWDTPGKCSLPIEVTPGSKYYFEIRPRVSHFVAGFFGGLIGQTIETYGEQCGGAFSVQEVNENVARAKLQRLRLSE